MSTLAIQTPDTIILKLLHAEFSSLCNTCDHFNACSYQDFKKAVIQCELFNNESGSIAIMTSHNNKKENAAFPLGAKGICMNCDKVWECRLPKTLAGVWHCEEYE